MKNIVLIGFMGSGKTTVGKVLADRLELGFVDTDSLIEERTGKSVQQIFREDGEDHFREIETRVVQSVSGRQGQVVSAGGGVVLRPANVEALRGSATLVYLRLSQDELMERTRHLSGRPLLDGPDRQARVRELMEQRDELYESAADVIIDVGELGASAVVDEIAERLAVE